LPPYNLFGRIFHFKTKDFGLGFQISFYERDLVRKCLGKDKVAQRELFLRYKDATYTTLLRLLKDEDQATDALQETFIAIFQGLNSFSYRSTLGAWIKTIAVRTGIAQQKKWKGKYQFEHLDTPQKELIVWPEELNSEWLEKSIEGLSTGYRTVFLLIEVEGYTHKEVANMLDISEGTSKSQLYHAKKTLQKLLNNYR
jgi:RNA polymerase sigma-70 factor (ECF subfamily)